MEISVNSNGRKILVMNYIDFYDTEIVHWLGTPYQVETHFDGAFLIVSDIDDEVITDELEDRILEKYVKFKEQENGTI